MSGHNSPRKSFGVISRTDTHAHLTLRLNKRILAPLPRPGQQTKY